MNTLIIILFLVIILFIIFNSKKNNNYIQEEYQYYPENYQQKYPEYINTYTPTVCDPYYQPCRQNWIYQQDYYVPI